MNIEPLYPFSDVLVIKPLYHYDERGFFAETFRQDKLEQNIGHSINFCQDNQSKSTYGTLRGLHYQAPPCAQAKLIQVIKGRILDILVDIRKDSPTCLTHLAIELNDQNTTQLFIPRGFAHGFVVLSEEAIINYKADHYYSKEHERGIAFNDPDLKIDWNIPLQDLILSKKDQNQPLLKDIELLNSPLYE